MVRSIFQRLICLILLAAYTVTGTSAVPAVVMILATLDGGHAVLVNESQGGTQVLLHHRPGAFTPRCGDHASQLTRAIVRLCTPSKEGDHRMLSAHVESTVNTACDDAKRDIAGAPMMNDQATMRLEFLNPWPVRDTTRANLGWTVPSAVMPPQLRALSSVQLLI